MESDELLRRLNGLTETDHGEFLESLESENLQRLHAYVEDVIAHKMEGIDSLFEVSASTLKFVPNFLLQQFIPMVEPAVSAAIGSKAAYSELRSLAGGLQPEYLARGFPHLRKDYAVALLKDFSKDRRRKVFGILLERFPRTVLELADELSPELLAEAAGEFDLAALDDHSRFADLHPEGLQQIQAARELQQGRND